MTENGFEVQACHATGGTLEVIVPYPEKSEEDEDTSMFGQAVGTIESPEAGEEFPEEVAQQLESEVPEQGRSLLGEQ